MSANVNSGAKADGDKSTPPAGVKKGGAPAPDVLSLEEIALHLATARAKYHHNTQIPDEAVCRLMLTTRMANLPLSRCKAAPSSIAGGGKGVYATRDIAEGELITLYPGDAVLIWEDTEHSPDSNIQIFFGKHIAPEELDVTAAVTEWRGYEVPCNQRLSVRADARRCDVFLTEWRGYERPCNQRKRCNSRRAEV